MKSTIYTMVVRDNVPELMPISNYGTLRMPDGKIYWIVPVETVHREPGEPTIPTEPTITHIPTPQLSDTYQQVIKLFKEGVGSAAEIGRRVGLSGNTVAQIIRGSGFKTGSDILRKRVEDTLLDSGEAGASPHVLGGLCPPGQRLGPIITSMIKRGEVKRLPNGNYAII